MKKSQKYFRFHFRVQKIFKWHLRFVGLSPSLSPSGATTSLASKTWKQDVLRETGKQNKQTRIQRWKSRNASFVPSLLPLFPHGFWHTGNRAGVRPLFFFPFLHTLDRLERIVFFFHSSQRIFLPGNIRQTLVGETRMTNGEGGGGGRERPLLQPVAHFGRWNGSSFEEVEKKMAEIIYIYM